MATYTINPTHTGTLGTLAALNSSMGAIHYTGTPSLYAVYVKTNTGSLVVYPWHRSLRTFTALRTLLTTMSTIDVLNNTSSYQDVNTYLTTSGAGYSGLCVVFSATTYQFYPIGTSAGALSGLNATLYNGFNTLTSSPDTFTSSIGASLSRGTLTNNSRGIAFPFTNASVDFTGSTGATAVSSDLTGSNWTTSFTVGVVARLTGSGASLLKFGVTGQPSIWNLFVNSTGQIVFKVNNTTEYVSTTTFLGNEQHHIAVTVDGTSLTVYVDGTPTNLLNTLITDTLTGAGDFTVGGAWEGSIQHVYRAPPLSAGAVVKLDWLWIQHHNLSGTVAAVTEEKLLLNKVTTLPSKISANALYYHYDRSTPTATVKLYMSDALGRQLLPVA